ncbi:MAG TPA: hypothetical protein VKZ53_16230 [Candidatus Angelobacter sp.]|nr:hypothetical protein [Candidatus Angelobacter sp.]
MTKACRLLLSLSTFLGFAFLGFVLPLYGQNVSCSQLDGGATNSADKLPLSPVMKKLLSQSKSSNVPAEWKGKVWPSDDLITREIQACGASEWQQLDRLGNWIFGKYDFLYTPGIGQKDLINLLKNNSPGSLRSIRRYECVDDKKDVVGFFAFAPTSARKPYHGIDLTFLCTMDHSRNSGYGLKMINEALQEARTDSDSQQMQIKINSLPSAAPYYNRLTLSCSKDNADMKGQGSHSTQSYESNELGPVANRKRFHRTGNECDPLAYGCMSQDLYSACTTVFTKLKTQINLADDNSSCSETTETPQEFLELCKSACSHIAGEDPAVVKLCDTVNRSQDSGGRGNRRGRRRR